MLLGYITFMGTINFLLFHTLLGRQFGAMFVYLTCIVSVLLKFETLKFKNKRCPSSF